jgi:hypothetical protein
MYCDPLAAEGLFPLATEDARRLRPDMDPESTTERDLPFDFDPGVDYFAKFDAMLPAWRPAVYEKMPLSSAAWTETAGGPVQVKMGRRQTKVLSHRRYFRAIHPDGSLRQLVVSNIRPTPAYPDGFDACQTHRMMVTRKSNSGWIVVENADWMWSPFSGKRGQEYAAWALAVMEYRRARHSEECAKEEAAHMSKRDRDSQKQTEVIANALTVALESRKDDRPRKTKGD